MARIMNCKICGELKPNYSKGVCGTCYKREKYFRNKNKLEES